MVVCGCVLLCGCLSAVVFACVCLFVFARVYGRFVFLCVFEFERVGIYLCVVCGGGVVCICVCVYVCVCVCACNVCAGAVCVRVCVCL